MRVLKGHGTENDFVVLPDLDGTVTLTPGLVRALCDRHRGVGADGVLRVVHSANDPESAALADAAPFFMDYRNADGTVAEMCGNGIRVVLRYLQRVGLVDHHAAVATRGGVMQVQADGDGDVTVQLGLPRVLADRPVVTAASSGPARALCRVELPNPHVVVEIATPAELAALDLSHPPVVEPARADGENVEFFVRTGPRELLMRVHERGSGETRSCGTGICAVAVAAARAAGVGPDGRPWRVEVPGGCCTVRWSAGGGLSLSGPAVIIGEIELDERWLAAAQAG